MSAVIGDPLVRLPQHPDDLEALLEDALIVLERDGEGEILLPVVAATGREVDTPATQEIERRPLLRDANRVMQGQHRDGGRKSDASLPRGGGRRPEAGAKGR